MGIFGRFRRGSSAASTDPAQATAGPTEPAEATDAGPAGDGPTGIPQQQSADRAAASEADENART